MLGIRVGSGRNRADPNHKPPSPLTEAEIEAPPAEMSRNPTLTLALNFRILPLFWWGSEMKVMRPPGGISCAIQTRP